LSSRFAAETSSLLVSAKVNRLLSNREIDFLKKFTMAPKRKYDSVRLLPLGLAAIAYALPTTEIAARDAPDRSQVFIQKLTWGGSGCPARSVLNFMSDDRRELSGSTGFCATIFGHLTYILCF
jgi:hypothetical protein